MAVFKFADYAHDDYNRSETAWRLIEEYDWPEEVAERYAANHKPLYEVKAELEYDSDTDTIKVVAAVIEGVRLVPEAV